MQLAGAVNIDCEVLIIHSLVGTVCPYVLDGFAERIAQCGVFLTNRKASTYALTLDIVKRVSLGNQSPGLHQGLENPHMLVVSLTAGHRVGLM